jgi:hypothetical protein
LNIRDTQQLSQSSTLSLVIEMHRLHSLGGLTACWIKNVILEKTELTEFLSKNEGILLAKY